MKEKNKLLKKLLQFFKRSSAFIGVVMVLLCSFAVPVFASGSTTNSSEQLFYSYWNLSKIQCTYIDGTVSVFDLPQTFYITNSYYNETITLSNNGKTLQLRSYVGSTLIDNPSVSFSFDAMQFSNIKFIFEDSVIRSYPFNYGASAMPPGYSEQQVVPFIQFQDSNNVVSSFTGSFTSVRPLKGASDDDYTFKFGESSGTFGLSKFEESSYNVYNLVNPSVLDTEINYYKETYGTSVVYRVPYFRNITVDLNFDFSDVSSSTYSIGLALPLGASSNGVSFNPVSEWYNTFFNGYKQFGDGANVDFTSWLSTAVGGFLSFEIIPGISFGLLLTFIIGIASVNFFLKFFAGG